LRVARHVDDSTFEMVLSLKGVPTLTNTHRVSGDKLTVNTSYRYPDGKPSDSVIVYRRTGRASADSSFTGEWVIDKARTDAAQYHSMRWEALPENRVRAVFQGGWWFEAGYDARRYPVFASRDDEVILERVSPRSVKMNLFRGGSLAESFVLAVADDGKSLTEAGTAKLMSGESFEVKAVYERQ
jgi:hypothetical protein